MRIRVSDPSLRDNLADYLRAGEFAVEPEGADTLRVSVPRARDADEASRQVRVYVATWRAMHQGAQADVLA